MTDISAIGGEFALLSRLIGQSDVSPQVVVPNGDDAAVIKVGETLLAVSTDSFVEGVHFNFNLSSASQVGLKAVECASSDLVAIGARPEFITIGLNLSSKVNVERVEEIYSGIRESVSRLGAFIIGGDTTGGSSELTISITVIGRVLNRPLLRKDARIGDLIYVSGPLGSSAAGLALLHSKIPGFETLKVKHQEPRCRNDLLLPLSHCANALIDVSDGLSSELHHIARASNVRCEVDLSRIPVSEATSQAAKLLKVDPSDLILHGGEDFELLFTCPPDQRGKAPGMVIGEVVEGEGVGLRQEGKETSELKPGGWNHFIKKR